MMQYGMPLMFGVMSFFFPAGLTLYIFTNTCLSALHSIYMNKYDKKSLAIAAQLKAKQDAASRPRTAQGVQGRERRSRARTTRWSWPRRAMPSQDDDSVERDRRRRSPRAASAATTKRKKRRR